MSFGEIEQIARQTGERIEIEAACKQLLDCHQELAFFERSMRKAQEGLSDSRVRLEQAITRMEILIEGMRRKR